MSQTWFTISKTTLAVPYLPVVPQGVEQDCKRIRSIIFPETEVRLTEVAWIPLCLIYLIKSIPIIFWYGHLSLQRSIKISVFSSATFVINVCSIEAIMKKLLVSLKYFKSDTVYICPHYDSLVYSKESPLGCSVTAWILNSARQKTVSK